MSTTENDAAPVRLVPRREIARDNCLEILDALRAKVESGEVIAFAAVGISDDDVTWQWSAAPPKFTWLRMVGAVARLMHGVNQQIDEA